ncbi:MAG: allantoate amidohydrolase [Chloroflexia bacterium]
MGEGLEIEPQQKPHSPLEYARAVMERADALGAISEEPYRLTRLFATLAMQQANDTVAAWMHEAGMSVRQDNAGNLVGRYEAHGWDGVVQNPKSKIQNRRTLVFGSHIDTVRDAGKYDGPLGVLVAIACVQRLHDLGKRLPFAIEVPAFADEEGLRYHTAYLGSKAYTGTFDPGYLAMVDADGVGMAEAIRAFGGDPSKLQADGRTGADLLGYCEVHIEQGPVLEARGLPVGVVSAISSQGRFRVTFNGEAGHAGTVPMTLRRDALSAAAEFVLAAERLAKEREGLVATVGQMAVEPGASNVIPGQATLSLDVRHMDDNLRREACDQLREEASQIASRRHVDLDWQLLQEHPSVPCSPALTAQLARAVEETTGSPASHLPSGAGHDAVTMSTLTGVAMLFVRCKGGVSHNPAESVEVEDVAVAIEVMGRFLEGVAG